MTPLTPARPCKNPHIATAMMGYLYCPFCGEDLPAATFDFPDFDDSGSWGEPIIDVRDHLSRELECP